LLDAPASSELTYEPLGWKPVQSRLSGDPERDGTSNRQRGTRLTGPAGRAAQGWAGRNSGESAGLPGPAMKRAMLAVLFGKGMQWLR
jgi:hypothetical protein